MTGIRALWDDKYNKCLNEIYESYDIGMDLVILDEVDAECYNYFCKTCEAAMKVFPISEHANNMEQELVTGVMMKWKELLKTLRKDSRYQIN